MLYQIYETQRSLMEPFSDLAQTAAKLFGNPNSLAGQSPLSQRISAGYDLLHRLGKDYVKPEFGLRSIDIEGVEVAILERIEMDKPFCELRRFKRLTDDNATFAAIKDEPVVLIVAPLSGHYATLLRDTVKAMLKDHKVYITDWKNARLVPLSEGEFHLDDYVNYVQEFIRHIQGKYGHCHVMSVCQPTVPVLAAVSLMASRGETTPLTMTMMGGPIDARKSPTAVNNLAMNKSHSWFENNVIYRVPSNFPGAGRRVYPGFLQHTGFVAMNPDHHAKSHYDYFKDLIKGDDTSAEAHRKFYDEYNAVLDMDADYYLETIRVVFQEFALVNGTWDVKGVNGKTERVRPADITTTALMSVEGELDDISGSGQTQAVHEICTGVPKSKQKHFEAKGAGHYGIFSGRRWRELVYPQVKAFILANHNKQAAAAAPKPSKPKAAAPTTEAKSASKPALASTAVAAKPLAKPAAKVAKTALAKPATKASAKPAAKAAVKTAVKSAPRPAAQNVGRVVGQVAAKKQQKVATAPTNSAQAATTSVAEETNTAAPSSAA
ncbi:polyhydroxyalkanoate depolymerase [Rhodoferax aquaticus]|uniref:Polyhydroxyalkanoate depolymerase n=1 Tax=Rhodoferax aquaticus TaxID=2527691 RepID=A0A515EN13_9BURK|nr:polyhydroxyalkanoate depolymerase [Rhodoferax aquaticus]QDL54067.1 polyhydroxyalkanoate depolymerase [Rhodoferax aquaticus]